MRYDRRRGEYTVDLSRLVILIAIMIKDSNNDNRIRKNALIFLKPDNYCIKLMSLIKVIMITVVVLVLMLT